MRRGISLIESIVILAVVALSAALLLPALHAARLRARDEICVNNLKQIGLALHNYHSANGAVPMSVVIGKGHGNGHSAFTALLPYMEQVAVFNAYNFHLENWDLSNTTSVRTTLEVFLCPENELRKALPAAEVSTLNGEPLKDGEKFGRLHYGVNWGGGRKGYGDAFLKEKGDCRGLIVPVATKDYQGASTKNVSFAQVIDGMSFTLAVVEKRDSSGWAIGGWSGSEFDVHTSPNYDGDDLKRQRVFTGSHHEAGPNALMADGSVKSLSPTLDSKIWYNLITRNGGEIINAGDF